MPCSLYKNKKKTKKRRCIKFAVKREKKRASTHNGQLILDFMVENKVKGSYKDYVILHGSQIIDWLGSYELAIEAEGDHKSLKTKKTALVHKSKLKNIIGVEAALRFWKCNMRTNFGVEARKTGMVRKAK